MSPAATETSKINPAIVAVILERMETLQLDVTELKNMLKCSAQEQTQFRERYFIAHGELENKTNQAHDRISALSEAMSKQDARIKAIEKLVPMMKSISYVLIGLSLPAILWVLNLLYQVLTHKVVLP